MHKRMSRAVALFLQLSHVHLTRDMIYFRLHVSCESITLSKSNVMLQILQIIIQIDTPTHTTQVVNSKSKLNDVPLFLFSWFSSYVVVVFFHLVLSFTKPIFRTEFLETRCLAEHFLDAQRNLNETVALSFIFYYLKIIHFFRYLMEYESCSCHSITDQV